MGEGAVGQIRRQAQNAGYGSRFLFAFFILFAFSGRRRNILAGNEGGLFVRDILVKGIEVAGDATAIEFFLQAIAGKPRNDHRDVVFAAALVCLINQLPHSAFQIRSAVYGFDHLLRFDFIR